MCDDLNEFEKKVIFLINNLRPYDVIEISRNRKNDKIVQIVCKNTVKEEFPYDEKLYK